MKRTFYLMLVAVMTITACQTKTKIVPVDTAAAKDAVTKSLEKYHSAFKAKDANAIMILLTENGLYCGTDSKELLDKASLSNMMNQTFADTSLKVNYSIDKREVRIATDGNSAIAIEQMFFKAFSQKMPIRMVYHLVKNNDNWLFDFVSWNFIPNNEDLGKLNKALE
ncbi:MAG TPA: nuclear transport factor 2 family protein [Bacteroidales bacterium]